MNVWMFQVKIISLKLFLSELSRGYVRLGLLNPIYNIGGAEEDRTPDPLRARQVLSQLSYDPNVHIHLIQSETVL